MNEISQRAEIAMAAWRDAAVSSGSGRRTAEHDAQLDPKLVKASHQFEASLMQELLKPLTGSEVPGEEERSGAAGGISGLTSSSEGSGSALMSFGSEALAKALSEKGGLGIARRILDHFETSVSEAGIAAKSSSGAPAKKFQDETRIHY